jgi:hypothetical protein
VSEWIPQQRDRVEHERHGVGTVSTVYRSIRGQLRACVRFDKFRKSGELGTGSWLDVVDLKPTSDGSPESTESATGNNS